jgi:3-keto-L-gulonate-6-phosphate decarboxylase
MKNQTAVSWLVKELNNNVNCVPMVHWDAIRDIVQKAKELEKQQIMDAYSNNGWNDNDQKADAELYYKQTYNL